MRLPLPLPFCLLFLAALPAQQKPPTLAEQVDRLCQPLVAAELAVGFVVGVIDGDTQWLRSYGVLEPGKEGTPDGDTLFEIGSVSKVFTGLLLADAVQRGLMSLEDPVQKFLPETFKLPTFEDAPVRLWHLATHTSGLPRLPDMEGGDANDPYAHFTTEKLYEALANVKLGAMPGSKYDYSNLAVGLLGQVIVRVEGETSYETLLRRRITTPLSMRDTGLELDEAHARRLAPPHDANGDRSHTWNLAALAGAGGIRSSVHDMLMFAKAQWQTRDEALAAAIKLALTKRHEGRNGIALALGWHIARDGITFWHNGETGGYHAYLAVQPSLQRAVCILANSTRGEIDRVGERILQHLHGMAVEPLAIEMPVAVTHDALARLVGRYRMSPTAQFDITLGTRGLSAQLTGQPALRLYARSATEFFYREVEAAISFEVDADQVQGLVLHQNGKSIRCAREASVDVGK